MAKSIIIIGAGIAGLSAGCYGRMNGYETQIFEMHDKPGGLCTSWKRKGYTFDGCIHWLVGTKEGSAFHKIWEELGALKGRDIINHEEFMRYEGKDGRSFIFYANVDRLEEHMKKISPGDAFLIEKLTNAIRRLSKLELPIDDPNLIEGLGMGLKMLSLSGLFREFAKTSVRDFASGFSDPLLREALTESTSLPGFPMFGLAFPLALMSKGDAGYPIGGSLDFARAIERRYVDLGGKISYRSRVAKILLENDRAVGVRLTDGMEHRADYVISAADGHSTIFEMLEERYVDERIRGYYRGGLEPFPPMIQVSLGVAKELSGEPHMVYFRLPEPIVIGGKQQRVLGYKHYSYDPTLAPIGKSVLVVSFMGDYDYWRRLSGDRSQYDAEKEKIAQTVIAQLGKRFPGFASQVEAIDVATPMTYERYTGNWRASFEGWLLSTKTAGMMMGRGLPKTLPGLSGFRMIGQWTTLGGGLPPAAKDGRDVIKAICRTDGKPFVSD